MTFCTLHRAVVFLNAAVVALVHQQISIAASDHRFALIAYCFMPTHLHLLVEGRDATSDFARFAKVTKQRTSYHYRQVTGRALLFHGGFVDLLLVCYYVGVLFVFF